MGASNSHIDSILYCGPECQKQQKIQKYRTQYLDLVDEEKSLPSKVSEAKQKYYMLKDGPEWYNKMIKSDSIKSSNTKYITEKKKLDTIKYKYNNISQLLSTQNILLDKQRKELKEKKNTLIKEENTISNLKDIFSTTNREIDYINKEQLGYNIENKDIVYIVILLVISSVLGGILFFKSDISERRVLQIMLYSIYTLSYVYFLGLLPITRNNIYHNKSWLIPIIVIIFVLIILGGGYYFTT
jgi:hypothetical protein